MLWYGDPGPGEMVNRHDGAVGPLSVNGRLFVQGETTIKAYDAYNGRHLWTHENPAAVRTGVYQNQNPGNLAAGDDSLFHFLGDKCFQVDMATGAVKATHLLPPGKDDGRYEWGYVATQNGLLFGTATIRKEIAAQARRRGKATEDATDGLFAIDLATGKHLWNYQGKSISHHTIAIGPDRIFFIDSSITSEQREELLRKDKSKLAELTGEAQALAEKRLKDADVRLTVALDVKTGEKLWEQAVDVTDCSEIGIGGGKLTMLYANDTLILCGANANGHFWKQFVAGEFQRRRLVVLDAYDGFKLWAKDANYRHRPIVIGKQLLAEPWMFDLKNGEQITRQHPITGEQVPWSIMRTGHHCGMLTACDSGMVLFRSGYTGFFDLNADEGVRHFAGHRLGCWINAIAANGLVMIPEASAGCVCQFSIASTIVLEPRESRRPWTIYSAVGAQTPVKHLAINLGAPGDRKDSLGGIWFSYPRRAAYQETALDVKLDLRPKFASGRDYESVSETHEPQSAETPWIYTSWAEGLQQLTLPLLGEKDEPANYTIRLHFADARTRPHEATTMSVRLNGKTAVENLTLAPPKDEQVQPTIVREVKNVHVERELAIELEASQGTPLFRMPSKPCASDGVSVKRFLSTPIRRRSRINDSDAARPLSRRLAADSRASTDARQRGGKIAFEIAGVLQSYGQPHQPLADAARFALRRGEKLVRRARGIRQRGPCIGERRRKWDRLRQAPEERIHSSAASAQIECQHSAAAVRQQPLGDGAGALAGKTRIEHARHARLALEKTGEPCGCFRDARHPQRQRPEAARAEPRFHRIAIDAG